MISNEYEQIFYNFINSKNIIIKKIPETNHKTPDFLVKTDEYDLLIEVTEMQNSEPYEMGTCISKTIGKKLKTKISDKKRQLKQSLKKYKLPIVLAIYDTCYPPETEQHSVRSIFGDLTLTIDKNTGEIINSFHGKNSELRHDKNTQLSAIIIARYIRPNDIYMIAYHNPYSEKPLPENFFKNNLNIDEIHFELD